MERKTPRWAGSLWIFMRCFDSVFSLLQRCNVGQRNHVRKLTRHVADAQISFVEEGYLYWERTSPKKVGRREIPGWCGKSVLRRQNAVDFCLYGALVFIRFLERPAQMHRLFRHDLWSGRQGFGFRV